MEVRQTVWGTMREDGGAKGDGSVLRGGTRLWPARGGHRPCRADCAERRGVVCLFTITTAESTVNLGFDP